MHIELPAKSLPVLSNTDVIVLGGSFAGVAAALEFARSGRSVVLVEPRTYLGREVSATLRPWLNLSLHGSPPKMPDVVQACIRASSTQAVDGEIPLQMDAVKRTLEDLLLAAKVKLIYASLPVAVYRQANKIAGVVIGNKSGRQVLLAPLVIDATENALFVRLLGGAFQSPKTKAGIFFTTIEFYGTTPISEKEIAIPPELGISGDHVRLHAGYRRPGHVLVEIGVEMEGLGETALDLTRLEWAVREKAIAVAAYLRQHYASFQKLRLAAISYEAEGPHTIRMNDSPPGWAQPIESGIVTVGMKKALVTAFAGPMPGLWVLNEAARLDEEVRCLLREPIPACICAIELASHLMKHWQSAIVTEKSGEIESGSVKPAYLERPEQPRLQVREPQQPQLGYPYPRVDVDSSMLGTIVETEVLVVGGGSSGAVAAIAAAEEGVNTCLVDMNPGLGGTGTFGGVDSYWCGYRGGYVAQVIEWVNQVNDELKHERMEGLVPPWNTEIKRHAFQRQAINNGVGLYLNSLVIGTVVEGDHVRGVVVATRYGPVAILAKVTIDATGDGDVAAHAGAEFIYGSSRDHFPMWFALHSMTSPGETRNNFTSTVDVRNIEDYTRAILSGRRRGKLGSDHDHTIYVAPRESRHILGDVLLTLNDHLLRHAWSDVVYLAFANNDIKGQTASDWMRMGFIPPHLEIEVPYRALLPKGLEDIIIVGKAISTTHDSISTIRMQADIENLGGAGALAAVQAIEENKTPRQIDIKRLQASLVAKELLPQIFLDRTLVPLKYSQDELANLVQAIDINIPLYAYSDMELDEVHRGRIPIADLCCAGSQAIPILEEALANAQGDQKILFAQMLAMMGAPSSVPVLVEALERRLSGAQLPVKKHKVAQVDAFAPDQAAMPVPANLLYSLGMARDSRAIPIWERVVDLLSQAKQEDIWSQEKGVFHYVDAVCVGAEQLGDPRAIPALQKLHQYPAFHGHQLMDGFQASYFLERAAYLEVVIGRALARCGSPEGAVILINYLGDRRALLSEQAHSELVAVTGQDFGKDVAAWSEWLESAGDQLRPAPWQGVNEAQEVWGKDLSVMPLDEHGNVPGRDITWYKAIG